MIPAATSPPLGALLAKYIAAETAVMVMQPPTFLHPADKRFIAAVQALTNPELSISQLAVPSPPSVGGDGEAVVDFADIYDSHESTAGANAQRDGKVRLPRDFSGDMIGQWSTAGVQTLDRLFADMVGFASDLRPWLLKTSSSSSSPPTVAVGLKTLFLNAWDVSAGAMFFQYERLLARSMRRGAWDILRRSARRAVLVWRAATRRMRRRPEVSGSLRNVCRLVLASSLMEAFVYLPAAGADDNDPLSLFDPYGILLQAQTSDEESETQAKQRYVLEYAWFLFATLRNVLTRSAVMTRPAGATYAQHMSLLAYLWRRIISERRKLMNGVDRKLGRMTPGLAAFFQDTDELRFRDWEDLFTPEAVGFGGGGGGEGLTKVGRRQLSYINPRLSVRLVARRPDETFREMVMGTKSTRAEVSNDDSLLAKIEYAISTAGGDETAFSGELIPVSTDVNARLLYALTWRYVVLAARPELRDRYAHAIDWAMRVLNLSSSVVVVPKKKAPTQQQAPPTSQQAPPVVHVNDVWDELLVRQKV